MQSLWMEIMPVSTRSMFGTTPIPRYVQLCELLRQRLDDGVWPVGATLPSIERLMAEFDVARVTVRQAISLLAGEGLLSPQRGRGTYVTQKAGKLRQLRVETTLDDLVAMYSGDKPEHATLEEGIATPRLVEADGVAAPKYFQMRRVHSRDGEPYCVISIFMDYRIFRRAPSRFRKELVLPDPDVVAGVKDRIGPTDVVDCEGRCGCFPVARYCHWRTHCKRTACVVWLGSNRDLSRRSQVSRRLRAS